MSDKEMVYEALISLYDEKNGIVETTCNGVTKEEYEGLKQGKFKECIFQCDTWFLMIGDTIIRCDSVVSVRPYCYSRNI